MLSFSNGIANLRLDETMPLMPLNGDRLTEEDIAALRTWIDEGAIWGAD